MKKNKSIRNLSTGLMYQVLNTLMGLFLPYLFITNLGSEANGLLNTVGQLFTALGLLEAGVGTATIQALYRPIAQGDNDSISSILSATNDYYFRTAKKYALAVLILCAVFPYLVDSELSNGTIRLVILLQGAGQVISFAVQAKYACLLNAEGKSYILNLLMLSAAIIRNAGKIIALYLGYGVVMVQAIQLVTVVLEAVVIYAYVHRQYPWLDVNIFPDYQAISQKNSVLIQSVAWMVFNHTDILVLTVFSRDLKLVSVYSIYLLIFEAVQNVSNTSRNSFQYKIGRHAQESKAALTDYYNRFSVASMAFSFAAFAAVYVISVPFVRLYTSAATDIDYLIRFLPELFLIYKVIYSTRGMNRQVIEATGHFKQTEKIAIIEMILNLAVSIGLVPFLGIHGVLLGTIAALIYSTVAYLHYLKKFLLGKPFYEPLWLTIDLALLVPIILFSNTVQRGAENYLRLVINYMPVIPVIFLVYGLTVIPVFLAYRRKKRIADNRRSD